MRTLQGLKQKINSNRYLCILLLPMLLYLLLWRAFPLIYTIFLSFHKYNLVYDSKPVLNGIKNYIELFNDSRFVYSVWISIYFMILATLFELILGTFLAIIVNDEYRGKNILQGILILPMVVSPVAVGTIWYILYNYQLGPISYVLRTIGFSVPDWLGSSTALYAVLIADIWQWTPFIFILVLAALQDVSNEILEAASIDGCFGFNMFRYMVFPLVKPVILTAGLLRAMDAFRILDKIFIMTGGGPGKITEVASLHVYRTAFTKLNFGYAAAQVIVILIVTAFMYWLYLKTID